TVLLIPVLASLAMKPRAPHVPRIVGWATRVYTPVLDRALARPRSVVAIAGVAFVGALALFPWLGREFMPTLVEQEVMLRITGIASASLEESIATSHRVERVLARFAETRHATAVIGRSERGETADVNYMEVLVELKPPEEWPRAKTFPALSAEMREAVEAAVPGIVVASSQPIQMRVDELISGVRSPLALKLYGDDLDALERLAGQARELLQSISGATDVSVEANRGKPQLVIRVDREAAGRFGVRIDALMDVVQTGIGGRAVSQVLDGTRRFDLVVRLAEPARIDIEAIRALPIRGADGALVPLSRIAAVAPTEGYSFVRREQLERYAIVQLGVEGRDMDGFVREADAKLAQALKLPTGFRWDWGGAFENQRRAMARLAIILPITIGLIFVLLYTAFGAVRPALLILAGIPLAAIGGVAALAVSGQYLSVPAAVGFIAVFGVAVLNGLVLVKVYGHLRDSGRCARESAREGSLLRLRPVLMTALVEVLGLLPFLLATGVGSEILRPLATVVVGGLASATLLTLVVLPAAYVLMHGAEPAAGDTRRDPAAGGAGAPGPGAPDVGAA
nr:efflux RND transporter permease subunit [Burkholderiales bacterium]